VSNPSENPHSGGAMSLETSSYYSTCGPGCQIVLDPRPFVWYNGSMAKRNQAYLDALAIRQSEVTCTPKQERFCWEYVKDLNKEQAYRRAGYKGVATGNVTRLFYKPCVQKKIAQLQQEKIKDAKITIGKVELALCRIAEMAENEGRYSAAIRAWELLGKYLGMFDQKIDITLHSEKTEEELDVEIARLQTMIGESDNVH